MAHPPATARDGATPVDSPPALGAPGAPASLPSAAPGSAAEERQRSLEGKIGLDRFVERPRLAIRDPDTLVLVDEGPALPPLWRRFGWLAPFGGALALLLWQVAAGGYTRPGATLSALLLLGLSVGLVLRRPRGNSRDRAPRALAVFDKGNGTAAFLRDREQPSPEQAPTVPWEDLRELIYARREVQIPSGRTKLMGGGLFLRTWDGAVWSLVPATLDADEVYTLGKRLASYTGLTLKQAGAGFLGGRSGTR